MSRTIRHRHEQKTESKTRTMQHRFDGHKMAQQVNHVAFERHAHTPMIERRGMRGK